MTCTWPEGQCECAAAQSQKPDPFGRVWMHCESGLAQTKASMARLMMFVLANNVELGSVMAMGKHRGALVIVSVRLKPEQFEAFERETGGTLRTPPKIKLN